jgi:thiol:disulfide interchange protein DsbA
MRHLTVGKLALFLVLVATLCNGSQAQVERFVEGVHYTRVPDSALAGEAAAVSGKTSVMEVFWYGCNHCYAFDPLLNTWAATQADRVSLSRSPMIWNALTKQHARLFYTAAELGLGERLHARIFAEIHERGNYLNDAETSAALFASAGTSAAEFARSFGSFAVDAQLRKAEALNRALRIPGVPALIVGGKYLINANAAVPQHQDMLDVASFLVQKEQAAALAVR